MDKIERTRSGSIAIPPRSKSVFVPMAALGFDYNAGIDQFVPNSPPEDAKRAYKAVNKFFENVADWFDPAGAKPRR